MVLETDMLAEARPDAEPERDALRRGFAAREDRRPAR
jgi:hypothetical protein